MSTPEPRPPRTTPNLGLVVPGDENWADYVTFTGAICDRLDELAAQISQVGMTRIADQRLSAAAGNINFPNIPQTYSHLRLILNTRGAGANSSVPWLDTWLRFNSDATASYDAMLAISGGTTIDTAQRMSEPWGRLGPVGGSQIDTTAWSTITCDIADYTSLKRKSYVAQGGSVQTSNIGALAAFVMTGWWRSEPAINTITLYISGDAGLTQFAPATRATLYALA